MRTHLDLFSGIGGFALAAKWNGVRTVGFCEREPYAQQLLRERFGAVGGAHPRSISKAKRKGTLADTYRHQLAQQIRGERDQRRRSGHRGPRLHRDICKLDGRLYRGVWLLTGGFPCQPFSVAGKRLGASDDRALWPEMLRVIDQARPAWVLGENVAGIINMELDRVLSDLESISYACRPLVVPACAVDAQHRRDRVWIVAHTKSGGIQRGSTSGQPGQLTRCGEALADAGRSGLQERNPSAIASGPGHATGRHAEGRAMWQPEPDVDRVAHGVPARSHRLRGLGNAIVPQVAAEFIRLIITAEESPVT